MEGLQRLYELLFEERDAARELDMDRLTALIREKDDLLPLLEDVRELSPEDRDLAKAVLRENRRNAYLFQFALNWTRETMDLLQSASGPPVYGSSGAIVDQGGEANLLSGKV